VLLGKQVVAHNPRQAQALVTLLQHLLLRHHCQQ
jgi:hypothetical protein